MTQEKIANKPNTVCARCGKPIYRKPYLLKRTKNHFCCREHMKLFKAQEAEKRRAEREAEQEANRCPVFIRTDYLKPQEWGGGLDDPLTMKEPWEIQEAV